MAERKFDYNNVGTVYNQMKSINNNIKDLLTDTDTEVHNRVDVCDEAIYGDLGNQLLLSWENISSSFPAFVDNFENWSALVAKASGDYSQFEADVAAFKEANPLGVTSAGAEYGAVATSSYNDSLSRSEIEEIDAYTVFYEPTGAEYVDTGMVKFAKTQKTLNIITDAIEVVSWIPIAGAAGKAVGTAVKGGAKAAGKAGAKVATKAVSKKVAKEFAEEAGEKMIKNGVSKGGVAAAKKTMTKTGTKIAQEAIEGSTEKLTVKAMREVGEEAIQQSTKKLGQQASKAIAQEAAETAAKQSTKATIGSRLKGLATAVRHPIQTGKAAGAKVATGFTNMKTGVSNGVKKIGAGFKSGYNAAKTGVKNAGTAAYNYASSADNIIYKNFNPVLQGKYGKFATGAAIANAGSDLVTDNNNYNPAQYSNQPQPATANTTN